MQIHTPGGQPAAQGGKHLRRCKNEAHVNTPRMHACCTLRAAPCRAPHLQQVHVVQLLARLARVGAQRRHVALLRQGHDDLAAGVAGLVHLEGKVLVACSSRGRGRQQGVSGGWVRQPAQTSCLAAVCSSLPGKHHRSTVACTWTAKRAHLAAEATADLHAHSQPSTVSCWYTTAAAAGLQATICWRPPAALTRSPISSLASSLPSFHQLDSSSFLFWLRTSLGREAAGQGAVSGACPDL